MGRNEVIQYLMDSYNVSFDVAHRALRDNQWDLMMAAGDIRDGLCSVTEGA
ncbi:hypothetical protein ABK178_004838 [Salmonella enterica subsp. enterica serovar Brandenburg]|nr:hypothetical protein [Salmonella enterica]EHO7371203.1 hypothetical protein [Salmonella enterica]EJH3083112.1 hypothetical protein [Salmonella enterica]